MSFSALIKYLTFQIIFINLVKSDCELQVNCDQQCQDQGYYTDAVCCKKPTFSECLTQINQQLCSHSSKICIKNFGFENNSSNCIFPINCLSQSIGCSEACLALGYSGNQDCKEPTQSYCLNDTNYGCTYDQSECVSIKGWAKNVNGTCVKPDCSQTGSCSKDACKYIGFNKSLSNNDCETPTIDECLVPNSKKCMFSESPCVQIQNLIQNASGDCELPSTCISNSACTLACLYLKYKTNAGSCQAPSYEDCLIKSNKNCGNSKSACIVQLQLVQDSNECAFPTNCLSNSVDCSSACKYLNYIGDGSKCEYPQHNFCLGNNQSYCTYPENACSQLGWIKKSINNNQCVSPPDCLTSCDSEACKYLGFVKKSGSCSLRDYDECLGSEENLCAVNGQSACSIIGFIQKNGKTSCTYPSDCENPSKACSNICLHLNYVTGSGNNSCELPTDQQICLNQNDNYCKSSDRACHVLGWKEQASNGYCEKPDCTQTDSCSKSACKYIGFNKSLSNNDCETPTIDECLVPNSKKCMFSQSPCVQIQNLIQNASGDCELPSTCISNSACTPACLYLKYKTNAGICQAPSYEDCLIKSNKNCGNSKSACIVQLQLVQDSNECAFPTNCLSNSVDCSSACKYLNYIGDGSKCEYPQHNFCLGNNQSYCTYPENVCSQLGWIKKSINNNQCVSPPDCLTSCDSEACKYLGFVKKNGSCSLRDYDECLGSEENLCAVNGQSACSIIGFIQKNQKNDCMYPNDCESQSQTCSQICKHLNYITGSNNNTCELPTNQQICLNQNDNYCKSSDRACHVLGWKEQASNGYCEKPDCTQTDSCSKSACKYIGFNKSLSNNDCETPTIDECLVPNSKKCMFSESPCVQIQNLIQNASGDCELPSTCISNSACTPACLYLKYKTNAGSCQAPSYEDCLIKSNKNCGNSKSACIVQLQLVQDSNECAFPTNCLSNSVDCSSACKYLNYIGDGSKCEYPQHNFCSQSYCTYPENACSQLGWIKKSINNNQCVSPPDCLTSCDSEACKYLGFVKKNGSCSLRDYDECLGSEENLCAVNGQSACSIIGFIQKNGKTSCTYPSDCENPSKACSNICLHLNYVTGSGNNSCELPTDQQICLNQNDNYCKSPERACHVLGWKKQASNSYCEKPDCLSSSQICLTSACSYLEFDINPDQTCKTPSIYDCMEKNQNRCQYSLSFCFSYGFIKSNNDNDCQVPDCMLNISTCSNQICQFLGYIDDSGFCLEPTYDQCEVSGQNLCRIQGLSSCSKSGFLQKNQTNDCAYPTNCESQSQACSQICKHLNYITGSNNNTCELPTNQSNCLNTNDDYCKHPVRACSVLGWSKQVNNKCKKPDCMGSKSECQTSACSYLGYDKNPDQTCKEPSIQDCIQTNKNRCQNSESYCLKYGFLKDDNNNDCKIPKCMKDLQTCQSQLCQFLGYVDDFGTCRESTYDECLKVEKDMCAVQVESACFKVGFVQINGTTNCAYPTDCESQSQACSQICKHLNYITGSNNNTCELPTNQSNCLNTNDDYCKHPVRACSVLGWSKQVNNKCKKPDCMGSKPECQTSACSYLGYDKNPDQTCKEPSIQDCIQTNKNRCQNSESYCLKYGFLKENNNNDCKIPNCMKDLQTCQSQLCQFLGYVDDFGSCRESTYDECLKIEKDMCAVQVESACFKVGFVQINGTTNCAYPTDCESQSQACSQICKHLNYITGSNNNTCELPTNQSNCLNTNDDYCKHPERACSVLGWSKQANNKCKKPDCMGSKPECQTSACSYLGYDKNPDQTCKEPSIQNCFEAGKSRCQNPLSFCLGYGFLKENNNNDCKIPNCMADLLICQSKICQFLGYSYDSNSCYLPSFEDCQQIGNNRCQHQNLSACVINKGFLQKSGSSDCNFPDNCLSNTIPCSDICKYLTYNTNGNTCQYLDYKLCLKDNTNYCKIPQKSCSIFGWKKENPNDSCIQPDCLNSIDSCQTNACFLLGYLRQPDNTCQVPTIDECVETGKNRCGVNISQCRLKGLKPNTNNDDCILPSDCLSQSNCSEACIYLGYKKDANNSCSLPSHEECLVPGQNQCSLALKACVVMGWDKSANGLSCINPDCLGSASTCQKDACGYLGYIKQIDNTCRESTIDECLQTSQNRCDNNYKLCVTKQKFIQKGNGDCDLPTDCQIRNDSCPGSCNYQGYVSDQITQKCTKPTNDDCVNQQNLYLCRASITFCTDLGWIKSKVASNNFCILPTCLIGNKCGSQLSSSACKYSGYIKNLNNDSCIEPSDDSCKNMIGLCSNPTSVCIKRGWEKDGNSNCKKPQDCTLINQSYCTSGKTACIYSGYVKSTQNDDCVIPTFENCFEKKNLYLCKNDVFFCKDMGFVQTQESGKSHCEIPSDCETNTSACAIGQIACQVKGYVKDKNSNKCVQPIDDDCYNQSNLYACYDPNSTCSQQNWQRPAASNQYFCVPPSDCKINNQCQIKFSACQYIGFVNDYNIDNCIEPTNSHCQNQVFKHLCRPGVIFCINQGYLKSPDSNKCQIPNCKQGQLCKKKYTACTYNGYIALSDGTCRIPDNNDCLQSSEYQNSQLCRMDIIFCTQKGYLRSTKKSGDNYCVVPTDCNDSQQCAIGLTACTSLGYKKGINDDTCNEPSDFDCYNGVDNPELCREDITFCTNKGWVKSKSDNSCEQPVNCEDDKQCTPDQTACFFLGYISNQGQCQKPESVDCFDTNNKYLCRKGVTFCSDKGWYKVNNVNLNYCVPPSTNECETQPLCSDILEACKYIGYVNNKINSGCMKPLDEQCMDSEILCRPDIQFCRARGYIKDPSHDSFKCIAPDDCLVNEQCGGPLTACIYSGFIPKASSDNSCKKPKTDDCLNPDYKYLCRLDDFDCIKTFKYVTTSKIGEYFCEKPKECLNGYQCTPGSVCLKLGFVSKSSQNDCKEPKDVDCEKSSNNQACNDDAPYCKQLGWLKSSKKGENHCVKPADCLSGNQCSNSLSACKYIGYVKSSLTSDQCAIPSDEQCLNASAYPNLCREGVGFCSDKGWMKNSANNSCQKPSDCLKGEQCGYGKICVFLGYVKEQSSNKCKIPDDDDCQDTNNIFACRTGNTFCISRGWKKTTDPNYSYCLPDVNCMLGNQCDPSLSLCRYLGYVQAKGSKKCKVPTDDDCLNQSNDYACRSVTSFCSARGYLKSQKTLSDKFCVSPTCLDGGNHCSEQFTACKYQGYVKKQFDNTCKIPNEEECINQSNNLCSTSIHFCTDKGFIKVSDPSQNYCVLPQDCLAGDQCSEQMTACRVVGGYVQSKTGKNCVLPDDTDCMNTELSLCRSGIDMCKKRGFVKSIAKSTDNFCVLPECLTVSDLCNPILTACTFGGYLKNIGNNNCYAPSDDDCANQNNKFLCKIGNPVCPSRGWVRNTSNPLEKSCMTPSNCLTSLNLCGFPFTACIYSGYLKNPNNNQCILPTNEQCLDQSLNLCKASNSPCIKIKGFRKDATDNFCVHPDNCLDGIQCGRSQVACNQLGYVKTSETFYKCVLPTDEHCLQQPLCYSDSSVCILKGYKKKDELGNCAKPDNCLSGNQCGLKQTVCLKMGYIKNKNDDSCLVPNFNNCFNNEQPNLCNGEQLLCKKFGFTADSKTGLCKIDYSSCSDSQLKLCHDDIKYCTSVGWVKSNSAGNCTLPKDCLNETKCKFDQTACSVMGYVSNQDGICQNPVDCKVGNHCSKNKTVCTSKGYQKHTSNDTCVCVSKNDKSGQCYNENAKTDESSSSSNILFLKLTTLILFFFVIF